MTRIYREKYLESVRIEPHFRTMQNIKPYLFLLLAVLLAGCSRQGFLEDETSEEVLTKRISVGFEEVFELSLGDTALVDGTDIELTFSFVSSESRCPSDVVCITAGEASILLNYSDRDIISRQVRASIPGLVPTPFHENEILHHNGNEIVLLQLTPYPEVNSDSASPRYKALLVVRS